MGKKKTTIKKKIQVPKESKIEEVINEEIIEEEEEAIDSEIEKDISEVKIKAESETSKKPKKEKKKDTRTPEQIIIDEWNKNVHISFKITKKDLVKVCLENGVKLDPKLETSAFNAKQKENHSFVQDQISMGFWDMQIKGSDKFVKLAEQGKALTKSQVSHIARVAEMMKDYNLIDAFEGSENKLPSTKQLAQLFVDMIVKIDKEKNNWFGIKYQYE